MSVWWCCAVSFGYGAQSDQLGGKSASAGELSGRLGVIWIGKNITDDHRSQAFAQHRRKQGKKNPLDMLNECFCKLQHHKIRRPYGQMPVKLGKFQRIAPGEDCFDKILKLKRTHIRSTWPTAHYFRVSYFRPPPRQPLPHQVTQWISGSFSSQSDLEADEFIDRGYLLINLSNY